LSSRNIKNHLVSVRVRSAWHVQGSKPVWVSFAAGLVAKRCPRLPKTELFCGRHETIPSMAVREIRIVPDPVLRTPCDEIHTLDERAAGLIRDLLDTVDDEGRAGLAANQIGVNLRAFSWNIDGKIGYVINPTIVELSPETQEGEEGCLSVPKLWFPTKRAQYARVVGIDLDGNIVVVEGEGLMARCLQHECDHLDGKLYLDRLERSERVRAMRELRRQAS